MRSPEPPARERSRDGVSNWRLRISDGHQRSAGELACAACWTASPGGGRVALGAASDAPLGARSARARCRAKTAARVFDARWAYARAPGHKRTHRPRRRGRLRRARADVVDARFRLSADRRWPAALRFGVDCGSARRVKSSSHRVGVSAPRGQSANPYEAATASAIASAVARSKEITATTVVPLSRTSVAAFAAVNA